LSASGKFFLVKHDKTQLAIKAAASLVLFVLVCALAGAAPAYVTPNMRWLYSLWFAI